MADHLTAAAPASGGAVAPEELERYAEAIVGSCLHIRDGDLLFVRCELDHRDLAFALAEAGYRAGARQVEVSYVDLRLQAARVRYGREEHLGTVAPWHPMAHRELRRPTTAAIRIVGDAHPGVFDGLPLDRLTAELSGLAHAERAARRTGLSGERRYSIAAWPTAAWAAIAYPELDADEGVSALARDILHFCRLGPDDPPGSAGWDAHAAHLIARREALGAAGLVGLELRGPGTRLDLALAPGVRWLGGPRTTTFGYPFTPNFPSEENHTSPLSGSTEGTFRCSLPLAFRGRLIDGIAGELRGGRLVRLEAASDDDRDFLAAALAIDPGARRIGEVALVDRTSRIGRTGRVYLNTLLDENAVAHMAFGAAYEQTRPPETGRRGLNRSLVHVDVMIGTPDLEATGITADRRRIPLLVDGLWQLP